ncbi:hypothetical protein GCM10010909_10450 [Acidocella aquatica]|uniref:Cytochrome c oxidase subunit IV n=1 Tax=Acidocella aquatica TaxID=1922313 RepID=A0ABQ6A8G8_9PROT|nr:cytochrome C oxidase subunit IV family protein [Acidocella aquatica]GLR66365.1 hypothetical protein GCM10010909_10450 [Acidocella aquatica]
MYSVLFTRVTAVWLFLLFLTAFSVAIAHGDLLGLTQRIVTIIVVIIAFLKVRFVGLEFMELRAAPLALRAVFEAWVALVCLGILLLYLFPGVF